MLRAEVHVHQPLVGLRDPILQSRRHAQLVALDRQHQRWLDHQRHVHGVELHETTQRGGDDRARPRQADLARDVGVIADREVLIVQRHTGRAAVVDESLDGGLDQPDAAVIPVQRHVERQILDAAKPGAIFLGQHDLDGVPLVEHDFRREVANDEREGPAAIAVGGIADQRRPRVGALADDVHRTRRSTNARSAGPCFGSASANSTNARKYASKLPMSKRRSSGPSTTP